MHPFHHLVAGATLAIVATGAFAQATPRVDQRQANQERRIDQGVASGQLNAVETRRLEQQQSRIGTAEANAKADGHVTGRERAKLHRMQDRASANVFKQKHDRQVQRR